MRTHILQEKCCAVGKNKRACKSTHNEALIVVDFNAGQSSGFGGGGAVGTENAPAVQYRGGLRDVVLKRLDRGKMFAPRTPPHIDESRFIISVILNHVWTTKFRNAPE